MDTNVKEMSVTKHINLLDGRSIDIRVSGSASDSGLDVELAKLALTDALNSGVMTILKNGIVKPIENRYKRFAHSKVA
ncbi:MAG: hypothetical protein A2323_09180 [Elusimicrobia bacterium RIFOXYB2_FULL_46_23]|nr:MAG: hypothetical protein A2323_09180 [Elusimicrobia bacterium RIFOXYB2_FULL_46_23]